LRAQRFRRGLSGWRCYEVIKENGQWRVVPDGQYAPRITLDSERRVSGPAAGHQGMKTNAEPNIPDGMFAVALEGDGRAYVKFLFACPIGGEMCGPEFTPMAGACSSR
jgi:secreted PhoX family phosphatase